MWGSPIPLKYKEIFEYVIIIFYSCYNKWINYLSLKRETRQCGYLESSNTNARVIMDIEKYNQKIADVLNDSDWTISRDPTTYLKKQQNINNTKKEISEISATLQIIKSTQSCHSIQTNGSTIGSPVQQVARFLARPEKRVLTQKCRWLYQAYTNCECWNRRQTRKV